MFGIISTTSFMGYFIASIASRALFKLPTPIAVGLTVLILAGAGFWYFTGRGGRRFR